ncbi:E3 ubiquitin-protein ligase PPP1R11 [Diachasma alloeum]|uniref:E3 ubiquitin-protein ligase PPP1R11 n=1 Tax=Diachasma alloeum TaxID=454923 RepID=UPI00073849A6|nr:E3 ubiquitin-protein ligase PPP1R11 [Diachasma alloeum]XP_015118850.1 E3 ubiquitin-protein ligase PPP1R11 [Diachasma alloeum]XP_028982275.1 E3 ubiquitin-protein ligase PPP1R11 [Diachasma alloeum]
MERMAGPSSSQTQTETVLEGDVSDGPQEVPTITLCLRKPRSSKKVQWTSGTVDNENMNKKKSKCCCIYEKPKDFGESSSEDSDDECEHCHGHKETHKKTISPPRDNSIPSQLEPIVTGST